MMIPGTLHVVKKKRISGWLTNELGEGIGTEDIWGGEYLLILDLIEDDEVNWSCSMIRVLCSEGIRLVEEYVIAKHTDVVVPA